MTTKQGAAMLAIATLAFFAGSSAISTVFSQAAPAEAAGTDGASETQLLFAQVNGGGITLQTAAGEHKVPIQTYLDADWGTLAYVTDNGIAAVPFPEVFALRTVNLGDFADAIRFSPLSGQSWHFDQESVTWIPMPETDGDVLLNGNYDVEMHYHDDGEDSTVTYLRFDRLRGDGWVYAAERWQRIAELADENDSEEK